MDGRSQLPAAGDLLGGGKYRVVRPVGSGGMGAVFEGVNLDTTRRVALKVLRPEFAARGAVVRRFAQEARAASRIEHPNIVGVFDLVQDGARVFIVEEFLDGEDLKQRVAREGPMAPLALLRVAVPVMEALVHAHAAGVVHRDVKPENVFLARTPRGVAPKVIDFGIARVFDDDGESLHGTAVGEVVGTAAYMSPEQARGDVASVDARTDVWSTGATLYFALTGSRPFEGQNRNQMLHRIINERPDPLALRRPDLPAELLSLVHDALEADLARRTPTMEAMLARARECLHVLEDRTEVVRVSLPPPLGDDLTQHDLPALLDVSAVSEAPEAPHAEPARVPEGPPKAAPEHAPEATPAAWEDASLVMKAPPPRWLAWAAAALVVTVLGGLALRALSSSPTPRAASPAALVASPEPAPPPAATPSPSPVVPVAPPDADASVARAPFAPPEEPAAPRRGMRAAPARRRGALLAPNPYGPEPSPPATPGLLPDPWARRP